MRKLEIGKRRSRPEAQLQRLRPLENKSGGHEGECPPATGTLAKPASTAVGIWLGRLYASTLGEAGDGFGFGVVDVEDGQELGDLEHFLELAAEVAEAQGSALGLDTVMGGDERTEPGAVNKSDVVHVEDNFLFSFGHQAFYLFTQGVAFLAEHNAAVQRHDGHAIHFAIGHLQSHVSFLLVGKRFRRQPEPEPLSLSNIWLIPER